MASLKVEYLFLCNHRLLDSNENIGRIHITQSNDEEQNKSPNNSDLQYYAYIIVVLRTFMTALGRARDPVPAIPFMILIAN